MRAVKNVLVAIEWMLAVAIVALGVTYGTATLTAPTAAVHPTPTEASVGQSARAFCLPQHMPAEWWYEGPAGPGDQGQWYSDCVKPDGSNLVLSAHHSWDPTPADLAADAGQ